MEASPLNTLYLSKKSGITFIFPVSSRPGETFSMNQNSLLVCIWELWKMKHRERHWLWGVRGLGQRPGVMETAGEAVLSG